MGNMWNRIDIIKPPENTRLLGSDGTVIFIFRYTITANHINWWFDNPDFNDIHIEYWQELPKLPPRIKQISAQT